MDRFEQLVARQLDELLSPGDAAELRGLIEQQPVCAARLAEHYALDRRLHTLHSAPPADAIDNILAAIAREETDFVESVFARVKDEHQRAADTPRAWLGQVLALPWLRPGLGYRFALAASLMFLVAAGSWLFRPTLVEPTLALTPGASVTIARASTTFIAQDKTKLQPADVLQVAGQGASAAITFAQEQTHLELDPGTELKVAAAARFRGKRFELRQGRITAVVASQPLFRPMVLLTPQAEARVLGTRFILTATNQATRLEVTEGKVRFTRASDGAKVSVGAGHYSVATTNYELAAQPLTGAVLREWWSGVTAKTLFGLREDPRFPGHPDTRDTTPNFELDVTEANRLVVRLCGWLHPPLTGDYEFWLVYSLPGSSDANLTMSPNADPADGIKIAQSGTIGATQSPPPIPLVAGRRYHLEAQILINNGAGHLRVEWKRPGGIRELLTGKFLSPFKPK